MLAGPAVLRRQPVGVQVVRDQVRAGPFHVRRAGRQPLGDLLQLGGQLRLGRALPVPALPVLGEDRPPRLPVRLRGYTTIPNPSSITGRSGCRADSRASPLMRGPPGGRLACRGPAGNRDPRFGAGCVTSVLILVRASAACAIGIPSLPALSQVRELETQLGLGAPRRIRTFDLPLRRRSLYPLSYRGRCPVKLSRSPAGPPIVRPGVVGLRGHQHGRGMWHGTGPRRDD